MMPGMSRRKNRSRDSVRAPAPPPAALLQALAESVYGMPPWMIQARLSDFSRGGLGVPLGATGTPSDRKGGRDLPLFWSELDLRGYRILARHICDSNPFGKGFLKLLVNYHVRKGFGWQACRKGAKKTPYATTAAGGDPLVAKGQQILDRFRDGAQWPLKSREAFRRWCRDGDLIGRWFSGGSYRLPQFRFGEPDALGSPSGNTEGDDSFGILTPRDDPAGPPEAFHFFHADAQPEGWVDASRVTFCKRNTDSGIKRGLPDFFPVAQELEDCTQLVRAMLATAIRQAKVAWIERHMGKALSQVMAAIPQYATQTGYQGQARAPFDSQVPWWLMPQVGSGLNPWEPPGAVRHVNGDREYEAGPTSTGVASYIQAEQAALRGCGVIWSFPEFFSGDASNANYASTLVAGTPFIAEVESTQYEFGAVWERPCALKVLEMARDAGLLTYEEWAALDVEVTEPAAVTPQPDKDTQTLVQQLGAKIISLDTVRQKLGLDPQHESEGVKKDAADAQPAAPVPAPALADDDDPLGSIRESRAARREGETWQVGSNWYTKRDGKIRKAADPSQRGAKDDAAKGLGDRRAKAKTAADKLAAGGKDLTHEDVAALDDHFATLTRDQMRDVARAIGAKVGGLKAHLAERLIAEAKARVSAPTSTPSPPAAAPSTHAVQVHLVTALNAAEGLTDAQREHYGQSMARVVRTMPKGALDRVSANLDGINFHGSVKDIPNAMIEQLADQPGLDDVQRVALRRQYSYLKDRNIGGVYMNGFQHIHVDGDGPRADASGRRGSGFALAHGIYAHELTHAIDGPGHELSASPEWREAFAAEISHAESAEPPLTQYAGTKPQEGFAEFGRLVYGSDVPHAQIAREFPKATAVFQARGLWPDQERTGAVRESRASDAGRALPEIFSEAIPFGDGSHADALLDPLDPAAAVLALAQLRADGDDEAAAELLELLDRSGDLTRESRVAEQGAPPFPGAVLSGDPPRWHNPRTGGTHATDAHHPHGEQEAADHTYGAQSPEEQSRFASLRAAAAEELGRTVGGRVVLAMGHGAVWTWHHLVHPVERRLLYAAKKSGELAVEAAKERGLSPEKAEALKRALYVADFVAGYGTGYVGYLAAGPLGAKAGSVLPSVSVMYLAYSTARNPAATWRAARTVVASTFAKGQTAQESTLTDRDLAAMIADRIDRSDIDTNWWLALFHAALTQTQGDTRRAVALADAAIQRQPRDPAEGA
jgi:hypothetical protein